jgi:hypothetical protein
MTQVPVFVQICGRNALHEASVKLPLDGHTLRDSLAQAGITLEKESLLFLDEDEHPADTSRRFQELKPGTRVHVSTCHRIEVTVNYLERVLTHPFPPGATVKRVKDWVVNAIDMSPTDAAEHVLQVCGGHDRPASDTPLNELAGHCGCAVCFEFVPDKRVEGAI